MPKTKQNAETESSLSTEDTKPLDNLDSISKRLKYIVDTLGVKQSHMAEKLGLSPSGLHYILHNDVRFSKKAKKIAEYLKINEQWLATGEGNIYAENKSITTYKVPLYYPDQLKLHLRSNKTSNITTNDFILTTIAYLNSTIGIYVTETDFAPKFEIGDMMIFEQTESFKDGDILLVYIAKTNEILLKYGYHLENKVLLISYALPPIKLHPENGDVIIGTYRECLKRAHSI